MQKNGKKWKQINEQISNLNVKADTQDICFGQNQMVSFVPKTKRESYSLLRGQQSYRWLYAEFTNMLPSETLMYAWAGQLKNIYNLTL